MQSGATGPMLARKQSAGFAGFGGIGLLVDTLLAVELEDEQPDRGRQVAVMALGIDRGNEVGQGDVAAARDLLQPIPERVLEAHAGLVPPDDYRSFGIQRLLQMATHEMTPMTALVAWGQLSQGQRSLE